MPAGLEGEASISPSVILFTLCYSLCHVSNFDLKWDIYGPVLWRSSMICVTWCHICFSKTSLCPQGDYWSLPWGQASTEQTHSEGSSYSRVTWALLGYTRRHRAQGEIAPWLRNEQTPPIYIPASICPGPSVPQRHSAFSTMALATLLMPLFFAANVLADECHLTPVIHVLQVKTSKKSTNILILISI